MAKTKKSSANLVTLDRRTTKTRRQDAVPAKSKTSTKPAATSKEVPPPLERRAKVNRRRQIDPTTCEREYTDDEVEFMQALDLYKRKSGRMFPTCSEVLEVIRNLGYVKLPPSAAAVQETWGTPVISQAALAAPYISTGLEGAFAVTEDDDE
ncbi:MAG: hypothetical protein SFX18_08655 [Pirellulales bacterium]|nr:hypothetical protein [Pirellulales bacterium]